MVGGGQAGGWAVKTLRDPGYAGALTLVTDEVHPPYERPPLSKALLAGKVAPEPALNGPGSLLNQSRPVFPAWYGVMPEITPVLLWVIQATF